MKVIGKDNLNRDYNGGRSEEIAGENLSEQEAKALVAKLNEGANDYTPTWYVVKPDDYVPYVFEGY